MGVLSVEQRHRLAAAKADGWLPIETAPKNASVMLLADHEIVRLGYWCLGRLRWCEYGPGFEPFDCSHWMPLPDPPKVSKP